ncbi:MAG: alpha/beta hydrolase-fold protein, partial [Streptococcus sp.]|nr:alpha/beta hydrolase-fold protein [Streptococcus sp.]
MNIEHLSHWSGQLNREMYVNRYGHAGIPVVVFASSGGSHNEYYDFGMIDACARFIEEGRVQFFTLSSVDSESWLCDWKNPHDRAEMHRAYERYVIEEAIPFIKHKTGWFDPMMTTGCSMGAYHALNFFLQHPDVFNKVVALSG